MTKRVSVLAEFKEADRISPKGRVSWAFKVLDGFMGEGRRIIYAEYEDDRKATARQAALAKEFKAEDSPFADKVTVERRGNRVYIAKA